LSIIETTPVDEFLHGEEQFEEAQTTWTLINRGA
jgi:hypothetical protein